MGNPNVPSFFDDTEIVSGRASEADEHPLEVVLPVPEMSPRERAIRAMGAIGFRIEAGPNAKTPEVLPPHPEHQPDIRL